MAKASTITTILTGALEDYLETILILVREHGFARVRDIAKIREVKSSSVSPALRRLNELGLVRYVQREYVGLTDTGERAARRVLARHDLLTRFFSEVLQMPAAASDREACVMEHSLSPDAMDRFVRFFEFLHVCPQGRHDWLEKFHCCSKVQDGVPACGLACDVGKASELATGTQVMNVTDLEPGQQGKVDQVNARDELRERLLDLGLLPDAILRAEHKSADGDQILISFKGSTLTLNREEAKAVLITLV